MNYECASGTRVFKKRIRPSLFFSPSFSEKNEKDFETIKIFETVARLSNLEFKKLFGKFEV